LEDLPRLYDGSYYTHLPEESGRAGPLSAAKLWLLDMLDKPHGDKKGAHAGRILNFIGPLRETVAAKKLWLGHSAGGSLLDVGCGNGDFLLRMKHLGWNAQGIDPDPLAVLAAQERGLSVQTSSLDEAGFPDKSFDVITMSHVIEHVPDPIELLKECRRVLKKGGQLILLTPNPESLGRRAFGYWWYGWEPPRHLMIFSAPLLQGCVEKAGLVTIQAATSARSARGMSQGSYLLRRSGSLRGANHLADAGPVLRLGGLLFWALESLACRWGRFGEEVRIHARRID